MGKPAEGQRSRLWPLGVLVLTALGATAAAAYVGLARPEPTPAPVVAAAGPRQYAFGIQIQHFCGQCHVYPVADTLPRAAWKEEVEQAYKFFADSPLAKTMRPPPVEEVVKYYEKNAPHRTTPTADRPGDHAPAR